MVDDAWKPEELIQARRSHRGEKLNIDRERMYVTGLSMGGYGTWRLAADVSRPVRGGRADLRRRRARANGRIAESRAHLGLSRREGYGRACSRKAKKWWMR